VALIDWVTEKLFQWGAWSKSEDPSRKLGYGCQLGAEVKKRNKELQIWEPAAYIAPTESEMYKIDSVIAQNVDSRKKQVLRWRYADGEDYETIAVRIKRSEATVYRWIERAHRQIAGNYE